MRGTSRVALVVMIGALAACKKAPPLRTDGTPIHPVGEAAKTPSLIAKGMGSCAMRKDGVWCWGNIGDDRARPRPERLEVDDVTAVALGDSHYCVLERDRTVACAGRDLDGELGDGKRTNRPSLAPVPGLANVVQLAAASFKTCAIVEPAPSKHQVFCFGADEGKLGSSALPRAVAEPTRVGDFDDAREVALDWGLACVRRNDGSVWCWGSDQRGQLGRGDDGWNWGAHRSPSSIPLRVARVNDAVGVSAGGFAACVLTARGSVGCWGENSYGALGDGTTKSRTDPSNVENLTNVAQVSRGGFGHACARRTDGDVWCWGYKIGAASGSQKLPVKVASIDDAVEIASGHTHACAKRRNGSIVCWGNNESSQLGDGSHSPSVSPREVMGPE